MPSLTRTPGFTPSNSARVQARSATLVAQLHDIALGEPKPRGVGRIDEHFRPLLSR